MRGFVPGEIAGASPRNETCEPMEYVAPVAVGEERSSDAAEPILCVTDPLAIVFFVLDFGDRSDNTFNCRRIRFP